MRRGYWIRGASALITFAILWIAALAATAPNVHHDGLVARELGSYPVTVNVTVKDNIGRAIVGAEVSVVGSPTAYPLSDANGTVLILDLYASDLGSGTSYNFTAKKNGYTEAVHQLWLVANLTYNLTLTVNGASVYGFVQTDSGTGLQAAYVMATSKTPPVVSFGTFTGQDGGYQFVGIPADKYDIAASKAGYTGATAYDVNLTAGLAARQDFNLTPLSGSLSGYVRNDEGHPLEGANVSVSVGGTTITIQTNRTGFYLHTGLPEGSYNVTASMNGFYSSTVPDIVVTKGMETKNVNLTLEPRPNRLYGVVKAGILLLPGVNITIEELGLYNVSNYEGSYQIKNISAGTYNISATLSGYYENRTQVTIPAGTDVLLLINLVQLPGAQLLVKVSASETGLPLVGVLVTISTGSGDPVTQSTNIDGQFAFTGLTPGNYTVQFVKNGYKPIEFKTIHIAAMKNETLTIQMEPLRQGDIGFIFGFDMAHSMMILALFLTIVILAMAVWLRIKTFQAPEDAPAVYDEAAEEGAEKEGEQEPEHPAEEAMRKLAGHPGNGAEKNGKQNGK